MHSGAPRRLTILCDWLPPDFGAVGQYALAYAREQAETGREVLLIGLTTQPRPDECAPFGSGRLTIRRLTCEPSGKGNLLRRGLWALGINLRLIREAHRARAGLRDGELIVTGSPPFLSSLVLALNRSLWRARLTYRITDFYPETVLAAGKAPWLSVIKPLVGRLRRLADKIEVLGEDQARRLREDGVPADRIVLRRDRSPVEVDHSHLPLPSPFEPTARVILYSGNLGVAHPTGAFLEAYRRHVHQGRNRVRLWMNGQGVRIRELEAFCQEHQLPLHLTPAVPLEELSRLLVTPDAHLVLLGEAFWGYVLPSKIYGCIASGKPILFVGPDESDVSLLIKESGDQRHRRADNSEQCFQFLEDMSKEHPP